MRLTDYSSAKTLQDAVDIILSTTDEHAIARYNCLLKYAAACNVIKELGVNQGSSLAAMMMQGNKTKVVGVDISLDNYKKGGLKELMESYAADKGFELKLIQKSSISESTVSDVELLHIDSLHHPKHLMKELELHAPRVSKYILFHDTKVKNYELLKVVNKYIERHPKGWELVENYTGGKCGHAAIKRK